MKPTAQGYHVLIMPSPFAGKAWFGVMFDDKGKWWNTEVFEEEKKAKDWRKDLVMTHCRMAKREATKQQSK
jgi:hypothetical protein